MTGCGMAFYFFNLAITSFYIKQKHLWKPLDAIDDLTMKIHYLSPSILPDDAYLDVPDGPATVRRLRRVGQLLFLFSNYFHEPFRGSPLITPQMVLFFSRKLKLFGSRWNVYCPHSIILFLLYLFHTLVINYQYLYLYI